MHSPSDILAVVGPTASGKTELGLRLAREQKGEIISVDSRQVYRDLRAGTAKPEGEWARESSLYLVQGIPYHLVDIWDPAEAFSAADFVRLASEKIEDIRRRGKKPILVGGTGLYLKALTEGLAPLPPRDGALRQRLREQADAKGRAHLHAQLSRVDPEAAKKIPANNIARVTRALEVYELTGKPISQWHREHQASRKVTPSPPPSPTLGRGDLFKKTPSPLVGEGGGEGGVHLRILGINIPRTELHHRIEERCRWMVDNGLIEETQHLLKKGYSADCPALTGLGYPRVIAYLHNKISRDELLKLLLQDTRQYAKRQMTWFRHQMKVEWNTL